MKAKIDCILDFLKDVAAHNDRGWFAGHKGQYEEACGFFEEMVQALIHRIAAFDGSVAHLTVKDFGAYINACGKKSWHSGYYFHLQPGECLLAGGSWCLPSPILKAVRQSIVDEVDEFRSIVEAADFKAAFPVIGETHLKTLPKGFPKDFPYPDYLRPKDYSVCHTVPDDFFRDENWLDRTAEIFELMKPFNDFVNYTIDECE